MRTPVFFLVLLAATTALGWEPVVRHTVSRSHQFIVYSNDEIARSRVAKYADNTKDALLKFLQLGDAWTQPIVIQLSPADAADPGRPPSGVRICNTEDGFNVQLDVVIGPDMRKARFPQQLIRALLLEYIYRGQPAQVRAGATYIEPPAWIIDGLANLLADPDPQTGSDLFRSLIASGKTPALSLFLTEKADNLDTPSRAMYAGCATSLVRLLAELPGGAVGLQNFLRHWPGPGADPEAELLKVFPALNSGNEGLEKWWALGLARLSAADRYQGLSLAETNQQLDLVLRFQVMISKSGEKREYTLAQYAEFRKAPGAKAALAGVIERLIGLGAQANPLLREVIGMYQGLASALEHGKTGHLRQQLAVAEEYRRRINEHTAAIADYLNWYEVNEQKSASGSFDEYIRTAEAADKDAVRNDPISKYLDGFEQQLSE